MHAMKLFAETRNIIGSILFNIFFWTYFMIIVVVLIPLYCVFSYKTMRIIAYRSTAKAMHVLLRIFLGIKYEVTGLENVSGQCIIGANHQSMWETLAIPDAISGTKDISVVVKKELGDTLLFGIHMKNLRNIAIDRSKPVFALKTLLSCGSEAKNSGDSILIFVTGTRTQEQGGSGHKVGVYALYKNLGLPVVPCQIDSGKCWGKQSFFKRCGTIHANFMKPIQPGLSREEFDEVMSKSFSDIR